jgi:hypothetical protein
MRTCGETSDGFAAATASTRGWCEAVRRGRYGPRRVSMGGGVGRREPETRASATADTRPESEPAPQPDAAAGEEEAEVEGGVSMGTGREGKAAALCDGAAAGGGRGRKKGTGRPIGDEAFVGFKRPKFTYFRPTGIHTSVWEEQDCEREPDREPDGHILALSQLATKLLRFSSSQKKSTTQLKKSCRSLTSLSST